jgi:hypothetical protein
MIKRLGILALVLTGTTLLLLHTSCKSCKKEEKPATTTTDTASQSVKPITNINLPHADTSLIPVLSAKLDEVYAASLKKDYATMANQFALVTPEGFIPYNAKDKDQRKLISITSEVLNKWNKGVEQREYLRVFQLTQPNGMQLPVLEVVFTSKKTFYRKFFVFVQVDETEYKILDIVSGF